MNKSKILTLVSIFILFGIIAAGSAHAVKLTPRFIMYIGSSADMYWVGVSGDSIDLFGCRETNEICWDATTEEGKRWLSLIMAAYLSGEAVEFNISGCLPSNDKPTFNFFSIGK